MECNPVQGLAHKANRANVIPATFHQVSAELRVTAIVAGSQSRRWRIRALKLYIPEKESPAIRRLLESEDQAFVELVRIELTGVFYRQLREKYWTRDRFMTTVRQFTNDDVGGF